MSSKGRLAVRDGDTGVRVQSLGLAVCTVPSKSRGESRRSERRGPRTQNGKDQGDGKGAGVAWGLGRTLGASACDLHPPLPLPRRPLCQPWEGGLGGLILLTATREVVPPSDVTGQSSHPGLPDVRVTTHRLATGHVPLAPLSAELENNEWVSIFS